MERRAFLAASTAAAAHFSRRSRRRSRRGSGAGAPSRPQVLELRRYRVRNGALASRFASYAKDALVPALGRPAFPRSARGLSRARPASPPSTS